MGAKNRRILWGSDRNTLVYLLGINALVYIMLRMLYVIFQNNADTRDTEYHGLISQFILNGNAGEFIRKPWTLFTHFFTHTSFSMFFSNMIWLFSFSWLLQSVAGNRYIFPAYFYGGVLSGIVFLLMNLFVPAQPGATLLTGATAATFGVSATAVTLAPNVRVFPFIRNGIPVWVLLAVFVAIDMISLALTRPVLIPVHLAGLLAGYGYAFYLTRGYDLGAWTSTLYDYLTGKKIKTASNSGSDKKFYTDDTQPFEKRMKVSQATIDEILDKINEHGYGSLTLEEKEVLKKAKHEL
ncbi:MAG: rhomboid family intramembrane serine protease [Dinghuibacter sp.]|nr:rhomboid family intramembrane serine protease [Dinghuibacter sp.]